MILFLTGSTETARQLIVDAFLDTHKDWRHLALEDALEDLDSIDEEVSFQDVFAVILACDVGKDQMNDEDIHLLITSPSAYLLETVQEQFQDEDDFTTVHLGDPPEGFEHDFEHILETKNKPAGDIAKRLGSIADA